jgi:transposase
MLKLNFTEEDFKVFQHERFNHPHPHVQRKMEVLLLKALEIKPALICKIADVCHKTRCTYINEYNTGGIEKVRELNFYRPKSDFGAHTSSIEEYLQKNPPSSISMASAMIEQLTGIKRSVTQTRTFLKSLGFSFRKTGVVPSKALTEEKKTNKENFWMKN